MEAISFSSTNSTAAGWCGGLGEGPYIMADLESGIWGCAERGSSNPALSAMNYDVVTAMVKGNTGNSWAIKGGDASAPGRPLQLQWSGPRPDKYNPMRKQGAIILGIGGDSSHGGIGLFLEGAMLQGFSSDAADAEVHADIAAAGYALRSIASL
jgi:hypothetical protein